MIMMMAHNSASVIKISFELLTKVFVNNYK